jgi:hypothetical protein
VTLVTDTLLGGLWVDYYRWEHQSRSSIRAGHCEDDLFRPLCHRRLFIARNTKCLPFIKLCFSEKRRICRNQGLGGQVTSCDSVAAPVTNQPVTPKALTAGQNRPHPPHIPSHFPEFPDPHTYIKTPVSDGATLGTVTAVKHSLLLLTIRLESRRFLVKG